MIKKYDLDLIRKSIDNLSKDIFKNCNIKRCNQWSNPCGCCTKGDYPVSYLESLEIKDFLEKNPLTLQLVKSNIKENKKCYFYNNKDKVCSIKNLRPIVCRFVSLRIFRHGEKLMGCSPYELCSGKKSTILSFEEKDTSILKNNYTYIYHHPQNDIFYLDFKKLDFLKEYYQDNFINLSDIIKNYFN